MHTAFLSELNSKREQNSRLRSTELNPKPLLHCHFSSKDLNAPQKPSKPPPPPPKKTPPPSTASRLCWENESQTYFKPIFVVHLTQMTAQAIILGTFSAAVMETWLLLHVCSHGILSKGGTTHCSHSTKSSQSATIKQEIKYI